MAEQLKDAKRVIETARHRIDCPHYHSFPSDVSSSAGICCQVEAEFRMALLEYDRKHNPSDSRNT